MSEEYWFFKNLGVIKHGSVYFCSPTCWLVLAFYWIDIALTLIESRWLQSNSANSLRSAQLFFALSVPIRYYQGFSLLPQYSFSIYFFHFSFFFSFAPLFRIQNQRHILFIDFIDQMIWVSDLHGRARETRTLNIFPWYCNYSNTHKFTHLVPSIRQDPEKLFTVNQNVLVPLNYMIHYCNTIHW